jgi:hypothetical protein
MTEITEITIPAAEVAAGIVMFGTFGLNSVDEKEEWFDQCHLVYPLKSHCDVR